MSLGMSFARRRMMAAAKKGPKYVWAVYELSYVRDDDSATTGALRIISSRSKLNSRTYSVDGSGFTLTNPAQNSFQTIRTGNYIVSITTSSDINTKTGTYLYQINAITYSGSYANVSYTRYGSKLGKGDTELYRVESDMLDYPTNGAQDGLWYVLVEGEV